MSNRAPSLALGRRVFALLIAVGMLAAAAAPPRYPDKTHLLVYRDDAGIEHGITNAAEWATRRSHILANMQEVMGKLPTNKVPLDVQISEEVKTAKFIRRKLTYIAEAGDRVPAYLFLPQQRLGPRPAVLCLHQTTPIGKAEAAGLGKSADLSYAVHLVERGYVTLAPDYPSFGDYAYDFRLGLHPSGSIKAVWNNQRALDLLASLPEVDGRHIGCIGHSLGGHNALFTAAFDTRIKAVVSNCGFTSFPKYYQGNLKGWTSDRYMPRIEKVYALKPELVPFDFSEVVAALAPRAFLAIAPLYDDNFDVSGVRDVMAAAAPVYELLGARNKLSEFYPDCKHAFPVESRKVAYEWLDRWLRN
jgi:dienelactone hydrolase